MLHAVRTNGGRAPALFTLAILAAAMIAACGSSSKSSSSADATGSPAASNATASSGDKPVKVAYFVTQLDNPFTAADIQGAKDAAAAMNSSVTVFNANFNPQTQLSQCQDAVTSGQYQVLEISPVVSTVLKSCIAQAEAKKIKVIAIDGPLGPSYTTLAPQTSGVTGTVLQTGVQQADIQLKYIKQACATHPSCQVGEIIGAPDGLVNLMEKTISSGLASDPHIKIVATANGQYLESAGQSAAQDMIAAHPGINVIDAYADQMAMGAQKVLQSDGKLKTVQLIGDGGSTNAATDICSGYWTGTVDANPYRTGYDGARIGIEQARGGKPQSEVDPATDPPALDKSNCAHTGGYHLFTIAG
jgi:ribose transport system substrate-binding protein